MNIFKKIARFFTVAYANRQYRLAVKLADKKHKENNDRYFVVIIPNSKVGLSVITRTDFRKFRNKGRFTTTYAQMKKATIYHTPDRAELNAMSKEEIELRRLSFIRFVLLNAKLA
jgi:hypothetical protein